MSTARRLERPGFGHDGGSNLADYLSATERAHQIELEMDPGERLVEIPLDLIDRSPSQARATFDEEEIAALGEDIQEHGLNHPVTVRQGTGGRYELVAGERRWLAAKRAGLTQIIARVRSLDDFIAHLVGVSENNRRANLSPGRCRSRPRGSSGTQRNAIDRTRSATSHAISIGMSRS